MNIIANVRPRGLKKTLRTSTFFRKFVGEKEMPDVRDFVGTLTLSATRRQEMLFLAEVRKFFVNSGGGTIIIRNGKGKEVAAVRKDAAALPESPKLAKR